MFCVKCGTKGPDGSGFCAKCGTALAAPSVAPPPALPAAAPQKKFRGSLYAGIAFMGFCFSMCAFVVYESDTPEYKARQEAERRAAAAAYVDAGPTEADREAAREAAAKAEKVKALTAAAEANSKAFGGFIKLSGLGGGVIRQWQATDPTSLTIWVENRWFLMPKGLRLQMAQNLQRAWAATCSQPNPDHARIKIVDANGNRLGGSRMLAGSLIEVDD